VAGALLLARGRLALPTKDIDHEQAAKSRI